ncbi:MAG TPA: hypothetical protein VJP80_03120 [Candidatus Saccharimonadales bacterium]|nr:hypothetical protein [Candidatus Saccharimonadales bacterium]
MPHFSELQHSNFADSPGEAVYALTTAAFYGSDLADRGLVDTLAVDLTVTDGSMMQGYSKVEFTNTILTEHDDVAQERSFVAEAPSYGQQVRLGVEGRIGDSAARAYLDRPVETGKLEVASFRQAGQEAPGPTKRQELPEGSLRVAVRDLASMVADQEALRVHAATALAPPQLELRGGAESSEQFVVSRESGEAILAAVAKEVSRNTMRHLHASQSPDERTRDAERAVQVGASIRIRLGELAIDPTEEPDVRQVINAHVRDSSTVPTIGEFKINAWAGPKSDEEMILQCGFRREVLADGSDHPIVYVDSLVHEGGELVRVRHLIGRGQQGGKAYDRPASRENIEGREIDRQPASGATILGMAAATFRTPKLTERQS